MSSFGDPVEVSVHRPKGRSMEPVQPESSAPLERHFPTTEALARAPNRSLVRVASEGTGAGVALRGAGYPRS